jgi:signal peptide peptidase SppA
VLAIVPQAIEFSYLFTGCEPNVRTESGIEIVTIHGPLEHHATWWWDSYESILERVDGAMTGEAMAEQHRWRNARKDDYEPMPVTPARAVVLRIDSPGGEAAGATYAHRRLKKLRAKYNVPLYAYANEMAASAAYELACAADEIWLPDTGMVGSIGVIATLFDRTQQNKQQGLNVELITSGERKADNHADRIIDDDVRARMRARVMSLAKVFWTVVADARGRSVEQIAALEAGVFTGQDAVRVGIADGVAGWDRFLRIVSRSLEQPEGLGAVPAPAV